MREVIQERLDEKRRENAMSKMQYCPKCKTDKPADTDHFYKDTKSKTGLSCWCKKCQRVKGAAYWKKLRAAKKPGIESKPDPKPEPKPETNAVDGIHTMLKPLNIRDLDDMTLLLDFTDNERLLDDIKAEAMDQMRTPEMQAMWLVSKSLYSERNQINE